MKNNKLISILTYGVFICTIIGFIFSISLGVKDKNVYNYIIAASNCLILTIVDSILMLIEMSRYYRRKLTFKNIVIIVPYSLISFIIGIMYMIILDQGLNIKISQISRIITALYQTLSAVITSTIISNIIILNYEKHIKNKKRTLQDKIRYD